MPIGMPIFVFSLAACGALAQNTGATPDVPITGDERVKWAFMNTIGPASLVDGLFSAGWGTLVDEPHEYGTHWDGFGKRYGMRLSGVATSNVMEAGLGAIWGEDPRYHRAQGESFNGRIVHVVKMTFLAENSAGEIVPAYARYAGIAGSNFLSNTWRADSEANRDHAVTRIALGFLGRLTGNAFEEFWPDLRDRVLHHFH
jgi:hypothetical protein